MSPSGKSCGACSVCCKELMFELDGTPILAGVMCPHAAPPDGCTIHASRPQVCRTYFCGWHHLGLPEEWRPDKSEILISLRSGPAPDGLMDGVEFHLVGSHDRLTWLPLVKFIAALIEQKTPAYLSLPGEIGFQSPWVYLNDIAELKDGIAKRDLSLTTSALRRALKVCVDYPKTAL